ncbi:MAG: NAD-dependent epimerase/dehydratase family protein [archaeon]
MKVLITGGSGLIGSALAERLVKKGVDVNVLDKRKNLNLPGVNLIQGSILNKGDLKRAVKDCDYVYHLAAIVGVNLADGRALECLDVNIIGTRNVCEASLQVGVKKILFASSSEVYGEPDKLPISEDFLLKPKSAYGWSKAVGEEYCKAFKKNEGLDYSVVRFCNVYGPNQALKFVLPLFINNALSNKSLEIYGSGEQIRSFCYVDDAARGTELVMMSPKTNSDVFNIGNPNEPISMKDLAKKVLDLAGIKGNHVFVPLENYRSPAREIQKRIPDISKSHKTVGFKPEINLDEGLKRVIEFKKKEKETGEFITPTIDHD